MEGAMDFREMASPDRRKLKDSHRRRRRHHSGRQSATGYGGFCCSCRLSISSPEETEPDNSERPDPLSAVIHTMVQERLEKLISETERQAKEKKEMTNVAACRNRKAKRMAALAVEKTSLDPREDLRESMLEMIRSNEMVQPSELRRLLECFLSLNSDGCAVLILEVFLEVCSLIFAGSSSTIAGHV